MTEDEKEEFIASLKNASRIVDSWPEWKRNLNILGPSRPPEREEENE